MTQVYMRKHMTHAEVERHDEALMISGFGWREASSITNEADSPYYTVMGRVRYAMDLRDPTELAELLARLGA